MFNEFIQIAGIIDKQEANLLVSLGAEYLGFPLRLPVNIEDLTEQEASEIIRDLPTTAHGILITYINNASGIILLSKKIGTKIIQLHDEIEPAELIKLKEIDSQFIIIKSLIVGKYSEEELFKIINNLSEKVDAFILDSYNPNTSATGATGIQHDWRISKKLVEYSNKPVILAGGLTPENVYEAIMTVKPAGVDTHTGVEDILGRKSEIKVEKFIQEAKRAFKTLRENQHGV